MTAEPLALGVVQPWDCDVMGHFTVRRYAAAFDDASYQLLFAMCGENPVSCARIGWADVTHTCEFHAEMRPGDIYEIVGGPTELGRSSVTVAYTMRLRADRKPVATTTAKLVRFDLEARKAVPIEGTLRARIEAMLAQSAP